MKIVIVGAGNMGLAMTAYISHKKTDHEVVLFTKKNILENGPLYFEDVEANYKSSTSNFSISNDAKEVFSDADIVFVTYPAFLRKNFVDTYGKYFNKKMFLGFVPGYGGIEYHCKELINNGITVFGFQRVPYVARYSASSNTAGILSKKHKLFIGSIPESNRERICNIINDLLDIQVEEIKEYLAITLAPSNPLLHISGLYTAFEECDSNTVFNKELKFYEEWNDHTSELLFDYDKELHKICDKMTGFDLREVVPLSEYYESDTPEKMTKKLKSIESFKAVMVPLKKCDENSYQIDLSSRMFVEDFPFGVCIFKDFANMVGVKTPVIDMLLDFYYKLSGNKYFTDDGSYTSQISETGVPGIDCFSSLNEVYCFYHNGKEE